MRRITIAVAVIVSVMLFSGMLLAQEQKEHKELKCKATCKGMMGLNLDEAQLEQLHELKYDLKMAAIDLKAELKKLRLQMKRELMKDEPSKKEVDRLVSEIGTIRTKMQKLRIDHLFEAKKILKPEQWKMFIKHHGMMHGRRGMAGCCPGGRDGRMQRRMHRGCGPECTHGLGHGCCEHEMLWFDKDVHEESMFGHSEHLKHGVGRI